MADKPESVSSGCLGVRLYYLAFASSCLYAFAFACEPNVNYSTFASSPACRDEVLSERQRARVEVLGPMLVCAMLSFVGARD